MSTDNWACYFNVLANKVQEHSYHYHTVNHTVHYCITLKPYCTSITFVLGGT